MKKVFVIIALMLLSNLTFAQELDIYKTHDIYWLGIDYNHCYFITSYDFSYPSDLKTKFKAWNVLIFNEKEKYIDNNFFDKKVTIASKFISQLNTDVDIEKQIIDDLSKTSHLSEADISEIVKAYNFPSNLSGIGLILIAESYCKADKKGYYYITFIDIESKKVLKTERMSGKARGFGVRNYWAFTYYKVLKQIGKKY
jgi:hypothetical protein